jgi:hypothetical protein
MEQFRITVPTAAMIILAGATLFSGCNQTRNGLFQNASGPGGAALAPAVTTPPLPGHPGTAPSAPQPAAPYVLSARSNGAFIDFSIYNLGETDLPVKREDFALISPDSRKVVPYTRDGAVIDLPQPSVVRPNATLQGRAVFNSVNNPIGQRLVFKPDATGTFADIKRP